MERNNVLFTKLEDISIHTHTHTLITYDLRATTKKTSILSFYISIDFFFNFFFHGRMLCVIMFLLLFLPRMLLYIMISQKKRRKIRFLYL